MALELLNNLYYYKAKVLKWVDADTGDFSVDLGFTSSRTERLRLSRINAPEFRGEEREAGIAAKEWLVSKLPIGSEVLIKTEKSDSFGRYIAEIWLLDGTNLNDELVKLGHAKYQDY